MTKTAIHRVLLDPTEAWQRHERDDDFFECEMMGLVTAYWAPGESSEYGPTHICLTEKGEAKLKQMNAEAATSEEGV